MNLVTKILEYHATRDSIPLNRLPADLDNTLAAPQNELYYPWNSSCHLDCDMRCNIDDREAHIKTISYKNIPNYWYFYIASV